MDVFKLLAVLSYADGYSYTNAVAAGFVNKANNTALRKAAYEDALMLTGALPSEI